MIAESSTREVILSTDWLSQLDELKDIDRFIRRSLTNYCAQAVLVDTIVHPKELELLYDLAPTLGIFGRQGSVEFLSDRFSKVSQKISPDEVPLLVKILDVYDDTTGSALGDRASALFLRLAGAFFDSDAALPQEELDWLHQFKEALYPPPETAPLPE